MTPEARRKALATIKEKIDTLLSEQRHLLESCNHERITKTSYGGAVCYGCGKHFTDTWYCPDSPDHLCHYSKSYDQCDYCGAPEERK